MDNLSVLFSLNGPASEIIGSFFRITYFLGSSLPVGNLVWRLLQVILATIFVALLAYYSVKMMGLSRGRRGRENRNLSVVESIVVGAQSMVQLVRAGDKYLVVGVTKERVTLLAELDEADVIESEATGFGTNAISFSKVLGRFLPPKDSFDNDDFENSGDSGDSAKSENGQDGQR